ncbi:hypothetical protein LshimejAT787_0407820 [Lyophyllum shimeji]|uniref:Uncharacterized protein n=1 Tax=Lyophyllum shimeji TaxID=47721 RepID=A0A9P3PL74_LYOSH|nr:hypothetical protein LshimejAT787_0407820 [Lyophyllum shimeji]
MLPSSYPSLGFALSTDCSPAFGHPSPSIRQCSSNSLLLLCWLALQSLRPRHLFLSHLLLTWREGQQICPTGNLLSQSRGSLHQQLSPSVVTTAYKMSPRHARSLPSVCYAYLSFAFGARSLRHSSCSRAPPLASFKNIPASASSPAP